MCNISPRINQILLNLYAKLLNIVCSVELWMRMRLPVFSMIQMTTFMNGDDILGFEFVYVLLQYIRYGQIEFMTRSARIK